MTSLPAGTAPHAASATAPLAAAQAPRCRLRAFSTARPKILVIGVSTGGPQALGALLGTLSPHLDGLPVLVVMHMPAHFVATVATDLERRTGRSCRAALDGETPLPGHIYLAPGNMHLRTTGKGRALRLVHDAGAPENFCRPSVDVLFRSVAESFGQDALAVVLTGMGCDGLEGARALVSAGASVIAQDEASSVVWGMPGAIAREGLAAAILSLDDMAAGIAALLARRTLQVRP